MTARSTIRSLAFVLLILLCVQVVAIAAPDGDRDGSAHVRAIAVPCSNVVSTRGSTHHDYTRKRPSAPALLNLVTQHGPTFDAGRLARAVQHVRRSVWTAGPQTGRSPPAIS